MRRFLQINTLKDIAMIPALPELPLDVAALRPALPAIAGAGGTGAGQPGGTGGSGFAGLLDASRALLGGSAHRGAADAGAGAGAGDVAHVVDGAPSDRPAPMLPPGLVPAPRGTDLPPVGTIMPPALASTVRIAPEPMPTTAASGPLPAPPEASPIVLSAAAPSPDAASLDAPQPDQIISVPDAVQQDEDTATTEGQMAAGAMLQQPTALPPSSAPSPNLPVTMAIPVAFGSPPPARNAAHTSPAGETILPDDGDALVPLPVAVPPRSVRASGKAELRPEVAATAGAHSAPLAAMPTATPLAGNAVANPDAGSAMANPATVPAQASSATGMETMLDQLAGLRDAARSARPEVMLRHGEFGVVNVRIDATTPGDWRATLTSRDPGFVPAVQAALAERAIAASDASSGAGPNTGSQPGSHQSGRGGEAATGQNAGSQANYGSSPGSGQGSQQPYLAQTRMEGRSDAPVHERHAGALQTEPSADRGLFA